MHYKLETPEEKLNRDSGDRPLSELKRGEYPAVLTRWEQVKSKAGKGYWVVSFENASAPDTRGSAAGFWILLSFDGGGPIHDSWQGEPRYIALLEALGKKPTEGIDTDQLIGMPVHISLTWQDGFIDKVRRASDDEQSLCYQYWVNHFSS